MDAFTVLQPIARRLLPTSKRQRLMATLIIFSSVLYIANNCGPSGAVSSSNAQNSNSGSTVLERRDSGYSERKHDAGSTSNKPGDGEGTNPDDGTGATAGGSSDNEDIDVDQNKVSIAGDSSDSDTDLNYDSASDTDSAENQDSFYVNFWKPRQTIHIRDVDDVIFGDEDFRRPRRTSPHRPTRVFHVKRGLRNMSAESREANEDLRKHALETGLSVFWDIKGSCVVVHRQQTQHEDTAGHERPHGACPRNCPDPNKDLPKNTDNAGDDALFKHREFYAPRPQRHYRQIRLPAVRRTLRKMTTKSKTYQARHRPRKVVYEWKPY